jgi:AraC-like DNA-binding protein
VNTASTIQAKAVEKIINAAVGRGVTASSLYQAAALDPASLRSPDHRIPFAQLVSLYEIAAVATDDHAFGLHVGESVDATAFDVLGYSVINSANLGEALARVVRYHCIWTDGAAFELREEGAKAVLSYQYLDPAIREHRHDAEMTFAAFINLARAVTGTDWQPESVSFQHARPADFSEHKRIFRCPVRFAAEANEFVMKSAVLRLNIRKADARLCAVLDQHAEALRTRYPYHDDLIGRAREIIRKELNGGNPAIEGVAHKLGMSPRTLQRKLREQDTSHQQLVDDLRKALALRYLNEPAMAIGEVAYLLGFSESSAFHRAFKRWTGRTPNEYREKTLPNEI